MPIDPVVESTIEDENDEGLAVCSVRCSHSRVLGAPGIVPLSPSTMRP
jgi:hypothetical protein